MRVASPNPSRRVTVINVTMRYETGIERSDELKPTQFYWLDRIGDPIPRESEYVDIAEDAWDLTVESVIYHPGRIPQVTIRLELIKSPDAKTEAEDARLLIANGWVASGT